MQAPRVSARVVAQDSDYFVAVWHQTIFTVFRGPATLQHVLKISQTCNGLLQENRGAVTYLSVIERSSPAPTETVRHALATWSRDVVSKMAVAVMVAEGGGFKNALVRGVGVALTVLLPHRVPFKFASTVEEGALLLAPFLLEIAQGSHELTLAIADTRRRWEQSL